MNNLISLTRFFIAAILVIGLSACGSSGGEEEEGGESPPANNPPELTSGKGNSVDENITQTGYTASATDADGDTITFGINPGGDAASFSINSATGALSFKAAPDFESPIDTDTDNIYVLEISATDRKDTVVQTVTITVVNVNDVPPVFTSSTSVDVPENTIDIGYTATASDVEGDTITFRLSGGADQVVFDIDSISGVLSFDTAPDFEMPADSDSDNNYLVEVTASDGINQVTQLVTVTVTDVSEGVPPVFTSGNSISVAENTTATGYTATATDADGDTVTFSLSGGADQSVFSINSVSGVLSFNSTPDFEVPTDSNTDNAYIVEITASDGINLISQTVTVTVTDVVENVPPVFTSGNSVSVSENTTVTGYTAIATDADGDAITFSLSGGIDQSAFSIDSGSGVLSFNSAPDFEAPTDDNSDNAYIVEISASDSVNQVTQTVTVTVTDLIENVPPVFTSDNNVSVAENTTSTGYTATATDADGDTVTFSLSGGADQSSLNIDGSSGVLTFVNPANFDAPTDSDANNDYEVEISASDGSNSVAQLVIVTVTDVDDVPVVAASPVLGFDIKTFRFTWTDVADATFYRLLENPDGLSGFTQVGGDILPGVQTLDHVVALYRRTNTSYILQSCNSIGCTDSNAVVVSGNLATAIGGFNSVSIVNSDLDDADRFGHAVSLSSDGATLAISAFGERSNATGIDGDDLDNSLSGAGAVYLFTRSGSSWTQQAYIKASNTGLGDQFGYALSISDDGNTLAVGARREASNATGINGDESNNGANNSGAVYMFTRSGVSWSQQAYIKASNTGALDEFGYALELSGDGDTLAVGAYREDSNATDVGGDQSNDTAEDSGAVYVFIRSGNSWSQQAYLKASNTESFDSFGWALGLDTTGDTLVIGARLEDSSATSIGGDESDNTASGTGAVYVFSRSGTAWTQQAYVKASNAEAGDRFGQAVTLSGDGNTLAVGAYREASNAVGIGNDETDNSATNAGAVYVFSRSGVTWSQQAYVKASNTDAEDEFGFAVSLNTDGNTLAVGAHLEDSNAIGIGGDETLNNGANPGVVYVYSRSGTAWSQLAYIKALSSLTNRANSEFGFSLSLSGDGDALAAGAPFGYAINAGAVFAY